MELNPEQLSAASQSSKNVLVLAGPGTGKTTALIGRYSHLIKSGTRPDQIFCCTFAKKASEEIKERVQKETGIAASNSRSLQAHCIIRAKSMLPVSDSQLS